MELNLENFTPFSALFGGMLIGLSATLLLLLNGRIAGVSGIMNGIFLSPKHERFWRIAFLAGLILGGVGFQLVNPGIFSPRQGYPLWLLIPGGFLVGFGTRMGSGCTSGHGICGIAILSRRSIFATLIFMATGMLTVFCIRYGLGVN
jgi:uncharacterized membrane protein YedE/YeeE